MSDYYHPQRSWGKVIFSQASVILLIGGVCGRRRAWQGGVRGRGACMAEGRAWYAHPLYQIRPVNAQAVCILLESILVLNLKVLLKQVEQCKIFSNRSPPKFMNPIHSQ